MAESAQAVLNVPFWVVADSANRAFRHSGNPLPWRLRQQSCFGHFVVVNNLLILNYGEQPTSGRQDFPSSATSLLFLTPVINQHADFAGAPRGHIGSTWPPHRFSSVVRTEEARPW